MDVSLVFLKLLFDCCRTGLDIFKSIQITKIIKIKISVAMANWTISLFWLIKWFKIKNQNEFSQLFIAGVENGSESPFKTDKIGV